MGGNRWQEATALSQKAMINWGSLVCQMGLFKVCQHMSSQTFMQCLIFLYKGTWRLWHTLWWIQCWDKTWPSGHQIQQLWCSMPEHGWHWRQAIDKFRCAERSHVHTRLICYHFKIPFFLKGNVRFIKPNFHILNCVKYFYII